MFTVTRRLLRIAAATSIILLVGACSLYGSPEWTAEDLQDWQREWAARPDSWHRLLYYTGSDTDLHFFRVRMFDSWIVVRVPRDQFEIAEERPRLELASNAPFPGYYALDPLDGWNRELPED